LRRRVAGFYSAVDTADGPLVLQGDRGYSVKSAEGQASYYYSQPFYEASGSLEIGGTTVRVDGKAWLDREWSSQPLAEDQTGWVPIPMKPPLCSEMIAPPDSGMISPP